MSDEKVLTKKIADQLVADDDSEDLDDFTTIEDAAAESFSKWVRDLCLNGLTELSDAAAGSFSRHEGYLGLDGLTSLSDVAAESLSKHERALSLDGLTELSDAATESLSRHEDWLSLIGLTSLSEVAASHMVYGNMSCLELGFQEFPESMVTALTPPQFENPLDDIHDRFFGDGPTLSFGRITNLTPDAAKEFARHFCDLSFSRLTALSAEVAEMLGKHEGFLGLSGLRELSDVAAESLSEHEGTLNLYGLLSLSEVAARHFVAASKRSDRSVLVLGFQEFPEELVTALTPPPQSDNPLDDITDIFGDYYTLRFPGLTALSDKVAEILGQHKGSFDLPRLTELSDAAAESLSKHEGNLYIKLDNLPASAAKILRDAGHGE